jgi:hypothetical protein
MRKTGKASSGLRPDGDPLTRPGDREGLLDLEPAAALPRGGESDRADQARGEPDLGALRIVDRLAQRALGGVADAIARIGYAVDHPESGGLAQGGTFRSITRRGRRRLLAAGGKHQCGKAESE